MSSTARQKKLAILGILKNGGQPAGGKEIAEILASQGLDVSDRTVRMYFQELEDEGFLANSPGKGRSITEAGLRELDSEKALSRVGIVSSRINQLIYDMTFDLNLARGSVIVNVTFVTPAALRQYLAPMMKVFELGYAMGRLVALLPPGAAVRQNVVVPPGKLGLCTVCSVTLNGVLLKHGIPVNSLFSGLLEVKNHQPQRFVEVIYYNGTSLDPLALFIQSGMTNYLGAIADGNGRIGAGYREVPAGSYDLVNKLAERLTAIGLGAFQTIGKPDQTVYNIPVHEGACGIVVIGGLNPTAVFEESGVRVDSRALDGVLEFSELFPYTELPARLDKLAP
jgi:repressor of nif and glnA expression